MTTVVLTETVSPNGLARIARGCLLLAGFLFPWIAIAAFPMFRFGLWIDSEPTLVVYHWIGALFAFSIFLNQLTGFKRVSVTPVLALFAGLIALSLLMMPFALDASLTWYGLPQTGQGILSFISFICYIVGFKQLLDEGYGFFMWKNAAVAILTVTSFTVLSQIYPENSTLATWAPFVFSAFLTFMALGLLALSFVLKIAYIRPIGIIIASGVILLSFNKTAIISLLVALGIMATISIVNKRQTHIRLWLSSLVALAPFIILSSMALFSSPTHMPSLWSRVRLIQMVGLELMTHPWEMITGLGWGSYTDTFLANLTRVSEAMYQNGIWNPTWDALERIDFHSHHQVVEALLATGILGAIIVLLLPAVAVYMSGREKLLPSFLVFFLYATTSSGWFEMPATLPFIALAYAAFWPEGHREISSKISLPVSAMAVILCFSGGFHVFKVGASYPSADSLITKYFGTHTPMSTDSALSAPGPGSAHLAHSLRSLANESSVYGNSNITVVEELSELAYAAASIKNPTLSLTLSLLTVIGDIAEEKDFPWVEPLRVQLLPLWPVLLENALNRAPYRTDLLAPYFRWQMSHKHTVFVLKWCDQILQKNEKDPIALWFKGLILRDEEGNKAKGYKYMSQALTNGVARLLPITAELQKNIENKVHL